METSKVWTDVVVRASSWSSDDNKLMEFFRIQMLLTCDQEYFFSIASINFPEMRPLGTFWSILLNGCQWKQ